MLRNMRSVENLFRKFFLFQNAAPETSANRARETQHAITFFLGRSGERNRTMVIGEQFRHADMIDRRQRFRRAQKFTVGHHQRSGRLRLIRPRRLRIHDCPPSCQAATHPFNAASRLTGSAVRRLSRLVIFNAHPVTRSHRVVRSRDGIRITDVTRLRRKPRPSSAWHFGPADSHQALLDAGQDRTGQTTYRRRVCPHTRNLWRPSKCVQRRRLRLDCSGKHCATA